MSLSILQRLRREPPRGTMGQLFAGQGIDWPTLARVARIDEFADALGHCTTCGVKADCGRWLEAGQRDGYQRFCPNAGFVERVKERAAR